MPYQEGGPIVASRMEPAMTPSAAVKRRLLVVLALVAAGLVVAYLVGVHGPHAKSLLSDLALAVVLAVSGLVVLRAAAGPDGPARDRHPPGVPGPADAGEAADEPCPAPAGDGDFTDVVHRLDRLTRRGRRRLSADALTRAYVAAGARLLVRRRLAAGNTGASLLPSLRETRARPRPRRGGRGPFLNASVTRQGFGT